MPGGPLPINILGAATAGGTSLVPSLISGGIDIIGGLLGRSGVSSANQANLQIARENREWQERMANTQYQRSARDLELAGLNRILAYGSPAPTPAGNIATMQNEMAPLGEGIAKGLTTAINVKRLSQDLRNLQATEELTKEARWKTADEAENIRQQSVERRLNNQFMRWRNQVYEKYPWMMETNMLTDTGAGVGGLVGGIVNSARGIKQVLTKAAAVKKLKSSTTFRRNSRNSSVESREYSYE